MLRKIYTRKEIISIIHNNGFTYERSNGGHDIYVKQGKHISIPRNEVNPMIWRRLMRENDIKEIY